MILEADIDIFKEEDLLCFLVLKTETLLFYFQKSVGFLWLPTMLCLKIWILTLLTCLAMVVSIFWPWIYRSVPFIKILIIWQKIFSVSSQTDNPSFSFSMYHCTVVLYWVRCWELTSQDLEVSDFGFLYTHGHLNKENKEGFLDMEVWVTTVYPLPHYKE